MNSEQEWQQALRKSPGDTMLRLAYADWLEEQGQRLEACKVRQQAGGGTLVFSLWHPAWGDRRVGEWTSIHHLKSHVNLKGRYSYPPRAANTYEALGKKVPLSELVVVVEWRANPVEITRLAYQPGMTI